MVPNHIQIEAEKGTVMFFFLANALLVRSQGLSFITQTVKTECTVEYRLSLASKILPPKYWNCQEQKQHLDFD